MIVLSTPTSGGIKPFSVSKTYYSKSNYISTANTTASPVYDSSSFSTVSDSNSRFQMEMVSRLSQEVRTTTTTGRIQELRQAVASGEYRPDPAEIAKRLLFHLEG